MAYYRAVAQAAASTPERIGVLLVNLGTPDSPSYFAVQRYLREFLSDRRVINTSRLIWLPILVRRGAAVSAAAHGAQLSQDLDARTDRRWRSTRSASRSRSATGCASRSGDGVRVALGMTYGNPSIASAIATLAEQNVRRLLVLPLYPQYCSSTTGSVFDRTTAVLQRWRWLPETRFVNDYYADAGYIDALAARIEEHWAQLGERSHLLFSYHGIPAAYVRAGRSVPRQAEATTRSVASRLGLGGGGVVALLPIALRLGRLAAAVHGGHVEGSGRSAACAN